MRVLVTGANGFAGRHALRHLASHAHETLALDIGNPADPDPNATYFTGDIRDQSLMDRLIVETKPEACLHLAGLAFIPHNQTNPGLSFEVNTLGTLNILEAFRRHVPSARIVVVSTAQIYGQGKLPDDMPVDEEAPQRPETLYAIAKAAADRTALLYARQYNMPVTVARPHNHIGSGQSPDFAVAAFGRQVKAIMRGESAPVLRVGNLACRRDFLDVRDVVAAYRLILENGQAGQAYNIASERMISLEDIVKILCSLAQIAPKIETDPSLFRPTDQSVCISSKRIRASLGWVPRISLSTTLRDILDSL